MDGKGQGKVTRIKSLRKLIRLGFDRDLYATIPKANLEGFASLSLLISEPSSRCVLGLRGAGKVFRFWCIIPANGFLSAKENKYDDWRLSQIRLRGLRLYL